MNRRGLLLGLGGILSAGIAPAIIHDPMKIFVRKQGMDRMLITPAWFEEEITLDSRWSVSDDQMVQFIKDNIAMREQAKKNLLHDPNSQALLDGIGKLRASSDYRLMQHANSSRVLRPMQAVDLKTWKPKFIAGPSRVRGFA